MLAWDLPGRPALSPFRLPNICLSGSRESRQTPPGIYADNTLIFLIEDDAQNRGYHVDAHRSIAFIAGICEAEGAGLPRTTQ
jgi:hypothetical protein